MFPFKVLQHLPLAEEHIDDNYDLVKHEVKLWPCCDNLGPCEDIILHCVLHGETGMLTVEDEHRLQAKIVNNVKGTKSKVHLALQCHLRQSEEGSSRYKNLKALALGIEKGDLVNDALSLQAVSRVQLAHMTIYWKHSVWTTTVDDPAAAPMRFACLPHGVFLPVSYSDGSGHLFSAKELNAQDVADSESNEAGDSVMPASTQDVPVQFRETVTAERDLSVHDEGKCGRGGADMQIETEVVDDGYDAGESEGNATECEGESGAPDGEQTEVVMPAKGCILSDLLQAIDDEFHAKKDDAAVVVTYDSDDEVPLSQLVACPKSEPVTYDSDDEVPLSQLVAHPKSEPAVCKASAQVKPCSVVLTRHDVLKAKKCKVSSAKKVKPRTKPKEKPLHHVSKMFACFDCPAHFHLKRTFKHHLSHADKLFPCPKAFCINAFLTQNVCKLHLATHSVKKHVCPKCNAVFKHKSVYDRHALKHVAGRRYYCSDCDKVYICAADLSHHQKQVHRHVKRAEMLKCDKCEKSFKTHRMLSYHSKVHEPKCIACTACKEVFRHYEARK